MNARRRAFAPLALAFLTACGGTKPHDADTDAGARVFAANCETCHGSRGDGGVLGPSLRSEWQRLDYPALVSWISDPQPPMPSLYPKFLTDRELRDVAAYVESL